MKDESKFWQTVKKNTRKITWTRLESWISRGVPDLLGYHDSCGFFMCELKIQRGNKIIFSPHQKLFHMTMTKRNFILVEVHDNTHPRSALPAPKCFKPLSVKLYPSSAIHDLIKNANETKPLVQLTNKDASKLAVQEPWTAIEEALLG